MSSSGSRRRRSRRQYDRLLDGCHQAIDQRDLDIAGRLLLLLEAILRRGTPYPGWQKDLEALVAAHERLWAVKHAESSGERMAQPA